MEDLGISLNNAISKIAELSVIASTNSEKQPNKFLIVKE